MVRVYVHGTIDSENALALTLEKVRRQKIERKRGVSEKDLTTNSDVLNEAVAFWKNHAVTHIS